MDKKNKSNSSRSRRRCAILTASTSPTTNPHSQREGEENEEANVLCSKKASHVLERDK